MARLIVFSVISLILAGLAAAEALQYRARRNAGWEHDYFRRRLFRRMLTLGLLEAMSLSMLYIDTLRTHFRGPWWVLGFAAACLAATGAIFLLIIRDLADTARYALKKHSEITAQSLRGMGRTLTHGADNPEGNGDE